MVQYISSGNDYKILNVSLTDTYQDISIPRSVKSFALQVRGDSTILWRKSASETDEWTFKLGQNYAIDGSMGVEVGTTIVLGQAKVSGAGGTDTLEIWYWHI